MTQRAYTLKDALKPSEFVEAYMETERSQYIGRLAPSLGLLIEHKLYGEVFLSKEFTDPSLFLGITHFGEGLCNALKNINSCLVRSVETVTLPLTLEMGFGKTHFLTLLWHLYTETPQIWSEISQNPVLRDVFENLTVKGDYKVDTAQRTIVFSIDFKKIPKLMHPYEGLFDICSKIIKKYNKLSDLPHRNELIKTIESLKNLNPTEAARKLAEEIRKTAITIPILILLDEIYARIIEAVAARDEKLMNSLKFTLTFINSLIDDLRGYSPVVLVYASAQQDIDRWNELVSRSDLIKSSTASELITVTRHFFERASRYEVKLGRLSAKDAIDIVVKRLFIFEGIREDAASEVGKTLYDIVKNVLNDAQIAEQYLKELKQTYPFTPVYKTLINKLLAPAIVGDLPETQHIRDLIKISSSIVARVVNEGLWDKVSLISLSHLSPEDVETLLGEKFGREWRNLYEACYKRLSEINDEEVRLIALNSLPVIYMKSVTTNISKLLEMMRASKSPEKLPKSEVLARGTSRIDLIFSLIGVVKEDVLTKFHDAWEYLRHSTPYINSISFLGEGYLLMSFISSPYELIESFKKEEVLKFTTEGSFDVKKACNYFKEHLVAEYNIIGKFMSVSEKEKNPAVSLINYSDLTHIDGKPNFTKYLSNNKFTILVVSPWSIIEEKLRASKITPIDYAEIIKNTLYEHKDKISYPNIFAVVVPDIPDDTLKRLCNRIAEVKAANRAVSYYKIEEVEVAKKKKLELAKKMPIGNLIEYLSRGEERRWLEDLVIEAIDSIQKGLQEYANKYTTTAVQNYVTDITSIFKIIIYYDPENDVFKKDSLTVKGEYKKNFEKIYGELPEWIVNSVKNTCKIYDVKNIRSYIKEKIIKPKSEIYVESEEEKVEELSLQYLPEQIAKGWSKHPIKILSKEDVRKAIKSLTGSLSVTPYVSITIEGSKDGKSVKVKVKPLKKKVKKEKTRKSIKTDSFKIRKDAENIQIMLVSLLSEEEFSDMINTISLNVSLQGGEILVKNMEKEILENISENIIEIIDHIKDSLKNISLIVKLKTAVKVEELKEKLDKLGVDLSKVEFR